MSNDQTQPGRPRTAPTGGPPPSGPPDYSAPAPPPPTTRRPRSQPRGARPASAPPGPPSPRPTPPPRAGSGTSGDGSPAASTAAFLAVVWVAAFGAALLNRELRDQWQLLLAASLAACVFGLVVLAALPRRVVEPAPVAADPALATPEVAAPPPPTVRTMTAGRPTGVVGFSVSKSGASPEENEDAWAAASDRGTACVSDGASSSFQSGAWARLLCTSFVETRPGFDGDSMAGWLLGLAQRFQTGETGPAGDGKAGWWDEGASARGSYATFAGIVVRDSEHGPRWAAAAVGDSAVLHLRPDGEGFRLVSGFPIEVSSGFQGSPQLIGSLAKRVSDLPSLRFAEGGALADDVWLLATDETARWALARSEAGNPIWALLVNGSDQERMTAIVQARMDNEVVNDDMTFAVVRAPA